MPTQDIQDLMEHVYGNKDSLNDKQYIMERGILTPKNETANMINNQVMQQFPGEVSLLGSCSLASAAALSTKTFLNYQLSKI